LESKFEYAEETTESLSAVYNSEKWGFINIQGEVLIDYIFDEVGWFSEGLCPVSFNGKYGYIEPVFYTEIVTKETLDTTDLGKYSEGIEMIEIDGEPAFRNRNYRFAIKPQYEYAYNIYDGLACVVLDDKGGYINTKGGYVYEPQFTDCSFYSEGLLAVKKDYLNVLSKYRIESGDQDRLIVYRHLKSDIKDLYTSPDGEVIALVSEYEKITIWDKSSDTFQYINGFTPVHISFSADNTSILVFTRDHEALIIDLKRSDIESRNVFELQPGISKVSVDCITDDLSYMVLDTFVQYYDENSDFALLYETSKVLCNVKTGETKIVSMRRCKEDECDNVTIPDAMISNDNPILVTVSGDKRNLLIWDLEEMREIVTVPFDDKIICINLDMDNNITVVTEKGRVTIYELMKNELHTYSTIEAELFSMKERE